ncbi:MAG: putative E3 ubiquitin-protein ligase [Geoglossum simile]|nr:MAG: putative E3 ubiquitin-protein ligase [Geoglossum simile]
MASWPARFISNPPGSNPGLPTATSANPTPSSAPIWGQTHITQGEPGAQPLCDDPILQPSSRQRTQHSRSISHPFPSFFSQGKRVGRRSRSDEAFGTDSTDDENAVVPGGNFSSVTAKPDQSKARLVGPEKDLITGRCMTCDSLVRWPKELNVFRCTICLTINDLKPAVSIPHDAIGLVDARSPGKVPPISLEKTRSIIDHCLILYLETRHTLKSSHGIQPTNAQHGRSEATRRAESDNSSSKTQERVTLDAHQFDREWSFDTRPPALDAPAYSASTPERGPSHLDRINRETFGSSVPSVPTRPPPPVPRESKPRHSTQHRYGQAIETITNEGRPPDRGRASEAGNEGKSLDDISVFDPLEKYIINCFASWECVNASFAADKPGSSVRAASKGANEGMKEGRKSVRESPNHHVAPLSNLDAKTLLLGDFAENGSWWTGGQDQTTRAGVSSHRRDRSVDGINGRRSRGIASANASCVDWDKVTKWYELLLGAGKDWRSKWLEMEDAHSDPDRDRNTQHARRGPIGRDMQRIGNEIGDARCHVHRVLLKATENLLKRPGRPLNNPQDIRFILIILANPLLYPSSLPREQSPSSSREREFTTNHRSRAVTKGGPQHTRMKPINTGPGRHSGITKRILGLLSNLPNECHHSLVSWFAQLSVSHFRRVVELVGSFVTHRLNRQQAVRRGGDGDAVSGLIPSLTGPGVGGQAHLHAALGITGSLKGPDSKRKPVFYNDDWQIKAAARVMALLFSANNCSSLRSINLSLPREPEPRTSNSPLATQYQIIPTSDFYNTLLDYSNLVADFEAWESRRGKFSFCQYPFFLSIWAKIHIMEYDARRQMEVKAREAFFDSIMSRRAVSQYLVLKVRRDCLVEDSLRGVSEVVGSGQEDIKKGLRIEFLGEEGVDAGGLRKEWFLLLVRDVFDPAHGMFVYDEDSHHCYFNPHSFETSDQFFLVGILLGLAIYNSTILDVALPPFAFKKLLASAPAPSGPTTFSSRPVSGYTLDDLAELRPSLASGLRHLLEFNGNVEETFCRDFVAEVDRYGQVVQIPLCPRGETRPVTNTNRREFVDLYINYLLDTSVARQYEPFKRGFYTVCGGNALSLFRPEEIELLVRGSDEPLDISSLRAVAVYENWGMVNPGDTEPLIGWFWEFFETANPKDQRKILGFITGSDRIPAMGATSLVIKIVCLGEESERFPVARTCFNALCMWRYGTRERLERKLWMAVTESEGFGLK